MAEKAVAMRRPSLALNVLAANRDGFLAHFHRCKILPKVNTANRHCYAQAEWPYRMNRLYGEDSVPLLEKHHPLLDFSSEPIRVFTAEGRKPCRRSHRTRR